jgi:hypothetical protein
MDFKAVGCDGIDWIQLAHDVVQYGVEPSGFVRGGEFLETVTVEFPRKGTVPWSSWYDVFPC